MIFFENEKFKVGIIDNPDMDRYYYYDIDIKSLKPTGRMRIKDKQRLDLEFSITYTKPKIAPTTFHLIFWFFLKEYPYEEATETLWVDEHSLRFQAKPEYTYFQCN